MRSRTTIICATVLAASLGGAALMSQRTARLREGAGREEVLYLPAPRILKRVSLGYDGLLADIYWTRTVQYFGERHHRKAMRYELLAPLLDTTTELDPHLLIAFQFGSVFLAQMPPEGAGEPDQAVQLVERGITANPAQWRLYYYLGWIEYDRRNYAAASRAFARGSEVKGAPAAMKVLSAAMAQHGGDRETAQFLWTQIYQTTDDPDIRANAVKRLQALQVDEDVENLENALQAYRRAAGHFPDTWMELEAVGWRGQAIDPVGNAYVLQPGGRVEVRDPDRLPFITRGLPPGQEPSLLASPKQREAVREEVH
jgi:hypothetical protein